MSMTLFGLIFSLRLSSNEAVANESDVYESFKLVELISNY